MMRKAVLLIIFATFSVALKAQNAEEIWAHIKSLNSADTITTDSVTNDSLTFEILTMLADTSENGGVAELVVPAEVGVMMQSYILQNMTDKSFSGYRIQILSVNSAQKQVEELEAIRDKFEEDYLDIPAYLQYTVPDFKIRVGNYRTKLEAIPDLNRIRNLYPDSYIVKCDINISDFERLPLGERRRIEEELAMQRAIDSLNAINQPIPDLQ